MKMRQIFSKTFSRVSMLFCKFDLISYGKRGQSARVIAYAKFYHFPYESTCNFNWISVAQELRNFLEHVEISSLQNLSLHLTPIALLNLCD